jgi:hypothetical protein
LFTYRKAKLAKTPLAREKRPTRAYTLRRRRIMIITIIITPTPTPTTSPSATIIVILATTLDPTIISLLTLRTIGAITAPPTKTWTGTAAWIAVIIVIGQILL